MQRGGKFILGEDKEKRIKLEKLVDKGIIVLEVTSPDYTNLIAEFITFMLKEPDLECVYVTINKPYSFLKETFSKVGLDILKLYFVDAISRSAGEESTRKENVMFAESPSDLTGISIALDQTCNELLKRKRKPLIIFDSVATLTIYSPIESVERFIHITTSKIRLKGFRGIIISMKKAVDEKLPEMIKQFCDEVIKIG